MHRITRPLVYLLIAAQLLLAVPALAASTWAANHTSAASHSGMPCHGMAAPSSGDDSDANPCCPDGAGSVQDCLATCTLGAALTSNLFQPDFSAARTPPRPPLPTFVAVASTPPLKPPPII